MPELEERQARLEGILEQIDKRLEHLEADLNELRSEMNTLRSEIHSDNSGLRGEMKDAWNGLRQEIAELRIKMDTHFRWIIGIMITMWVTMTLTILFKA